jgi:TPR repeat protein
VAHPVLTLLGDIMLRILLAILLLSSMAFAKPPINKSGINFSKDIQEETVKIVYEFGVEEYNYANYGQALDFFTAIVNRNSNYPGAYYYLGKIYEEVALFKDETLAQQCYLKAATDKNLAIFMRQEAYSGLIRLTTNTELAMKYAKASFKLGESETSKKSMIAAYHKQYNKTGDVDYLNRAEIVNRTMTDKYFQSTESLIQTNFVGSTK